MRAMQSPGGLALLVIFGILIGLLLLSATAVLSALAVFLLRRSRGPRAGAA